MANLERRSMLPGRCGLLFLLLSSTLTPVCCRAAGIEDDFQELQFRKSVEKALQRVQQILDTTRNPRLLEEEDHVYDDKFALAEFLTNTVVAAEMNALEALGLDDDVFTQLWKSVHQDTQSVTMRFQAEKSTLFVKEEQVSIVTSEHEVEEVEITESGSEDRKTFRGGSNSNEETKTTKTKISETVLRRHWKVGLKTRVTLFMGTNVDDPIELLARNASRTFVTSGGTPTRKTAQDSPAPQEKTFHFEPIDINLTWLMLSISQGKMAQFAINRQANNNTCKTPRRNEDVEDAIKFLMKMRSWGHRVASFFSGEVSQLESYTTAQLDQYRLFMTDNLKMAKSLFHPTLPLLENSTLLSDLDLSMLLKEQAQRIDEANNRLQSKHNSEDPTTLISAMEAKLIVVSYHVKELVEQYLGSINYLEHLLRTQLIRAIGKEVTANDFEEYMRTHYQKIFGPNYAPKLYSYAVRRPNHYPDGIVSIEAPLGAGSTLINEPVQTFVKQIPTDRGPKIRIPLNAATSVEIKGDQYLHGWLQHRFNVGLQSGQAQFQLAARAHQFSNFLLVVGTMAGPNKFKPSSAIIVQNKDEVLIPLTTEIIPSAKEFKDAISSLSPEQQAFAKAFRALQLESSLFGVCVIQLKPQLETLLGLPPDTLTKEIKLTQDLMNLFVEYQIPSDLLSVHHDLSSGNTTEKLDSVKDNVRAVMDVIEHAKEEIVLEEKRKAEVRMSMYGPTASPSASPSGSPSASPSVGPSASPSESPSAGPSESPSESPSASPRSFSSSSSGEFDGSFQSFSSERRGRPKTLQQEGRRTEEAAWDSTEEKEDNERSDSTTSGSKTTKAPQRSLANDFTLLPKLLDSHLEKHDKEGSLRSTTVKAGNNWSRTRKVNLITPSQKEQIWPELIEAEKKKAFDLLDALSRSGSLPIEQSELHVVVVLSHCFEDDLISTLLRDNINPIEKAEKSSLLVASTIHGQSINELVGEANTKQRLQDTFPELVEATMEIAAKAA